MRTSCTGNYIIVHRSVLIIHALISICFIVRLLSPYCQLRHTVGEIKESHAGETSPNALSTLVQFSTMSACVPSSTFRSDTRPRRRADA